MPQINNIKEIKRGGVGAKEWVLVGFTDEKDRKVTSFDEWLLDIEDGQIVEGVISEVYKDGQTYYNFKAKKGEVEPINLASTTPSKKPEVDWDAIALGKVRHGVVCAMISAGLTNKQIFSQAPQLVKYIMDGPTDEITDADFETYNEEE